MFGAKSVASLSLSLSHSKREPRGLAIRDNELITKFFRAAGTAAAVAWVDGQREKAKRPSTYDVRTGRGRGVAKKKMK